MKYLLLSIFAITLFNMYSEYDRHIKEMDIQLKTIQWQNEQETQRLKLAIKAINDNQQIHLHQMSEN